MGISNWGMIWTIAMPVALILYYFYRKKYKDQPVSSIMYWQQMMKEMQASPYLKKLQQNSLFYLQLAALVLLVFALLGPYLKTESLDGGEFIFVIDTSASMLAGSPTQLEQKKTLMKNLAGKAGGKPVTIIAAGSTPEVLIRKETSDSNLQRVIDGIEAGYESPQMEKTLLYADTLVESGATAIHILTDSLDRDIIANRTGASYTVHASDEPLMNISIRQFGVTQGAADFRAIVQLVNDSGEPVSGSLEVSDGDFAADAQISLEPGEEQLIPFDNLPDSPLWQATLDADDDYSLDNRAFAYSNPSVDTVILDNTLHGLVAKGMESLGVEVNAAAPEQLSGFTGIPLITNQSGLLSGDTPILLIGRNDAEPTEAAGAVETANHPLFAFAPMENIFVAEIYPEYEGFETIASVGDDPFIQLSPEGDIIVLADIQATDWPLSPSFPLFLWSAINELTGSEDYLGTFWPNEQRSVNLASADGEWEIFKGEEYHSSYIEGQRIFQAPKEPGIYRLVNDEESKNFIVQLSNEEKSIEAGQNFSAGTAVEDEMSAEQSAVPWILLLILILMLAEWEVYRRGTSLR